MSGTVVYANNISFYTLHTATDPTPFDTLVIAFAYPTGVPGASYFTPTFQLIDWGTPDASNPVWTWLQTWQNADASHKIYLSFGGAGGPNFPEANLDAMFTAWGADLPAFRTLISNWKSYFENTLANCTLDGVDLDYEYFSSGDSVALTVDRCAILSDLTNNIKAAEPSLLVSHAPQIPYITSNTYGGPVYIVGVYVLVLNGCADNLDFLFVQCYNNAAFVSPGASAANPYWAGNSVTNMNAGTTAWSSGVGTTSLAAPYPYTKLRFGLPLTAADASSGYITPAEMVTYYGNIDTQPLAAWAGGMGLMFWQLADGSNPRWTALGEFNHAAFNCLAGDTEVLTEGDGYVALSKLTSRHRVVVRTGVRRRRKTAVRMRVACRQDPGVSRVVTVPRHFFARGVPDADVTCSPEHCFYVDLDVARLPDGVSTCDPLAVAPADHRRVAGILARDLQLPERKQRMMRWFHLQPCDDGDGHDASLARTTVLLRGGLESECMRTPFERADGWRIVVGAGSGETPCTSPTQ